MTDESLAFYGLLLVTAGFASGFGGGLFGIGGGLLRVPIFLYLFPAVGVEPSVSMHMAAGTSLALALPTGLRTALSQHRAGKLDMGFVRSWVPALLVGVVIGVLAARHLPGSTLALCFGIAMIPVAVQMIALSPDFHLTSQVPGQPIRGLVATAIGGLSAMIGLSGGAFTTPALTLLGYPIHRAIAVSAAGAIAIAGAGAIGSVVNGIGVSGRAAYSIGYVDLLAVAVMLPTILISAPLGVKLANRLSELVLRRSFGIFLIVVAADMIRNGLMGL